MKLTIKQWLSWKYKRTLIILKNRSLFISNILNKKSVNLTDMEKSLFDIAIKLIANNESILYSDNIEYVYHIELENYMIIIKPSLNNFESYTIKFSYNGEYSNYIELNLPPEYTKQVILRFNREIQRRMKKRQSLKIIKVNDNLKKMYDCIN